MLPIFDGLRELTSLAVACRMILAVVCGGVIGLEREYKRRSAGFRTHILICLGATMTMLTSHYLSSTMHYYTDIGRLGAQVVAGIGFIGAGTIIVTKRRRVKGLTTAAGLWSSAIIGLCLGAGFYEGALLATVMILVAELVFSKLEYRVFRSGRDITLYVEYEGRGCLDMLLRRFKELDIKVADMEISRADRAERHNACVIFTLHLRKEQQPDKILASVSAVDGVLAAEEL